MKQELTPIRLNSVVFETEALLAHNISHKQINLVNRVDPLVTVCADSNMIKTIVRNLLSNAIKYTSNEGTITITSESDGESDFLKIEDTGIGMTDQQLGNLFNIESNISTPGTNNEPGTGLGLLLCKELAEKNNAQIQVDSTVGKGSIFTIAFLKPDKVMS
jgi:signal transduction histidine kinase